MASDDEYSYDYSDEDDYQVEDGDDDAMDWKPVVGSGDNPNAAPMAGTCSCLSDNGDAKAAKQSASAAEIRLEFWFARDTTTRFCL